MEKIKLIKLHYIVAGVATIVICGIIYIFMKSNDKNDNDYFILNDNYGTTNYSVEAVNDNVESNNLICIHIVGEVNNPGVFEIEEGSRIKDVVDLAGGFTEMANIEKVNLAYQVSDGQKIKIPNKNDNNIEGDDEFLVVEDNVKNKKKVNINTAKEKDLESISRNRAIYSI